MKKRTLIYARTATPNLGGILAQLNECEAYAADNGLVVVQRVVDSPASGLSMRHPGAVAMSKAVSKAKVDAILVTRLDRISRSAALLYPFIERAKRLGIDVVTIDGDSLPVPPLRSLLHHRVKLAMKRRNG